MGAATWHTNLRRLSASGPARYDVHPLKNKYSHPHDALQYLMLGAGEGRKIMHQQVGKAKHKSQTKWNPFQKKRRRQTKKVIGL